MNKLFQIVASVALAVTGPTQVRADAALDAFVEANILAIFYHELGHVVIDLMNVPIFGQEEDAADVMAVLLIDQLFDESSAQDIAYDSAFGFFNDPDGIDEVVYWDTHGPDEQRFYNHVCLFFGANPTKRSQLANDLELPEARAESCPEEYEQAADSWETVFEEMQRSDGEGSLKFEPGSGPDAELINRILSDEVNNMNQMFALPETVAVKVETCDEPNAFYDPETLSITFCREFVPHLKGLLR